MKRKSAAAGLPESKMVRLTKREKELLAKSNDIETIAPIIERAEAREKNLRLLETPAKKRPLPQVKRSAEVTGITTKTSERSEMPLDHDPQPEPHRPPSKQPGYIEPARAGTVAMTIHMDRALRTDVNSLAELSGMTRNEFSVEALRNVVNSAKEDPKVAKALKAMADLARKLGDPETQRATRRAALKGSSPS